MSCLVSVVRDQNDQSGHRSVCSVVWDQSEKSVDQCAVWSGIRMSSLVTDQYLQSAQGSE